MKKSYKNIILYSLLALLTFVALFFFYRTNKLHKELVTLQKNNTYNLHADSIFQQLMTIDSLVLNEDFGSAREAYEALLQNIRNDEFTTIIQQRINKLQAKESRQAKQQDFSGDNLQQVLSNKSKQIDSLSQQLALSEEFQVDEIDSLRFVLAKANMRIESLSVQLANKTKSNYLKFTNEKGTEIYYVGEIKNNKAKGWGVALYSNGSRYEGEWEDNMRDGEGVFYWPDGEYYKGNFALDQRQGEGKYYWPNGEMFTGEWQNDKRNGEGIFYGKNGDVVAKGIWQNNELVKKE